MTLKITSACAVLSVVMGNAAAFADQGHDHSGHAAQQEGAIASPKDTTKLASFDIIAAHVHRSGDTVTFHMTTAGVAGADGRRG